MGSLGSQCHGGCQKFHFREFSVSCSQTSSCAKKPLVLRFSTESKKREFIMNGDPTVVEFPNKYKPYSCVLSSLIADLRGAVCVQLK